MFKELPETNISEKYFWRNVNLNNSNFLTIKKDNYARETCCNQGNSIFTGNIFLGTVIKIALFKSSPSFYSSALSMTDLMLGSNSYYE